MFQGASQVLTTPVNALVKDVILQVCMYVLYDMLIDGVCLLL